MATIKSIEEKAKAYDEAIEALGSLFAKQAIKHCDRVYIKDITNIFPELKESEDEITWIINYLNNRILNSTIIAEKENLKKAITWLEKQGEQKSAWSKEDELMISRFNNCIGHYYADNFITKEQQVIMEDWLNSLKDRVLPQPKREWSDEDEKFLDGIIANLEYLMDRANTDTLKQSFQKRIDWLKSLRHQPQWKPSDLPHWQKSNLPNNNTTGFNSDYFCHKGYIINYKELFEKLPKDD